MPVNHESNENHQLSVKRKYNVNTLPVYGYHKKLFVSEWRKSKVHHDIEKAFDKMEIQKMRPIQQNSFPYLIKNCNTAMVGSTEGKSLSYLTSVLSSIRTKKKITNTTKKNISPRAVIISSSVESCTTLGDLAKQLLSSVKTKYNIKVIVAYTSICIQDMMVLCYGCDILISTPTCFKNMIVNAKENFRWSKIKHFVFDNMDLLLDNYKDYMFRFFANIKQLKTRKSNIQMISASINWNTNMDEFLNTVFVKWQYIFGCHFEAARYMNMGFNVVQVKDDKLEHILKFLASNSEKYSRCVLMTTNSDEMGKISSYIKQDSNIEVLLPEQKDCDDAYTLEKWRIPLNYPKKQIIFICNDEIMSNFYIDNADCLIHYDIPVNINTFTTRFSVFQTGSTKINKNKVHSTHIFLGNNNIDERRIPKVVEIMQMFGSCEIEPALLKQAKVINIILEKENKNSPFCSSIQQFGYCSIPRKCQFRHIFIKELDEPALNIPKMGRVAIQILNVYDASHISAKLLYVNCTKNHNEINLWSKVDDHSATIKHELKKHYSNPDFRTIHINPQLGDIVAIPLISETDDIVYSRAIVIEICKLNNLTSQKLKVKLIDEGCIEIVLKATVLVLPDVLKNIQTTTVDIFLTSVKPLDFARKWSVKATNFIKSQIKNAVENLYHEPIVINVEMALGTTIWVSRLFDNDLNLRKKYEFEIIISDMLLNFGHAEINDDHLETLIELSISAGIETPLALRSSNELDLEEYMSLYKLPQGMWLNLDQSGLMLLMGDIITPNHFYVRNSTRNSNYGELQTTIDYVVEHELVENLKYIAIGGICLGKRPGEYRYNRVQVIKIINYRLVDILLVDFGEVHTVRHNSLLTINEKLIITLPFQAVECGLSGVKDIFTTDTELKEVVKYLYNLTQKHLCLIIIDELPEKCDGSCHYEVLLFNEVKTVNLEFHENFSHYCDYSQISKLVYLINEQNLLKKCYNNKTSVIDTKNKNSTSSLEFIDTFGSSKQTIDLMKVLISKLEMAIAEETIKLNSSTIQNDLCMSCNVYMYMIVPFCSWYQSRKYVYLKLSIPNIEKGTYKINSTIDSISFVAKFNNKTYSFHTQVYDMITGTNHVFSKDGLHIRAEKLYKLDYNWPRLFSCDKHHNFLEYDSESTESDDSMRFLSIDCHK